MKFILNRVLVYLEPIYRETILRKKKREPKEGEPPLSRHLRPSPPSSTSQHLCRPLATIAALAIFFPLQPPQPCKPIDRSAADLQGIISFILHIKAEGRTHLLLPSAEPSRTPASTSAATRRCTHSKLAGRFIAHRPPIARSAADLQTSSPSSRRCQASHPLSIVTAPPSSTKHHCHPVAVTSSNHSAAIQNRRISATRVRRPAPASQAATHHGSATIPSPPSLNQRCIQHPSPVSLPTARHHHLAIIRDTHACRSPLHLSRGNLGSTATSSLLAHSTATAVVSIPQPIAATYCDAVCASPGLRHWPTKRHQRCRPPSPIITIFLARHSTAHHLQLTDCYCVHV